MLQDNTPDAAESSAGDDFHILWSIQKCLKLINFEPNGLKAISVENLSTSDSSYLNTGGGMSLGVDLTEYYGGTSILDSERIVVSQLKYSTRTPDKDWTAARICTSSKGGSEGSIIDRLAQFYSRLSAQIDRSILLDKVIIKLVSNRPAADKLVKVLETCKSLICQQRPNKTSMSELNAKLTAGQQKDLSRLLNASKLDQYQFVDFVSLLDLSDCNQSSRFQLEQQIIAAITKWTAFKTSLEYTYLHKLIWGKMMPEQKQINTVVLSDVILAFGLADISAIFPVNNKISAPEKLVPREQLSAIKDELLKPENQLICLHGGAGIGKSTLVNMIPSVLPEGSVSVIFDCYGGGSYLDPEDRRHKHQAGILQICNELSLKAGSSLLLSEDKPDEFYLKQLKERMSSALAIMRAIHPEAVLAIILDAADNSVTASELYDGKTFIRDLSEMQFPEGCNIILSARTERLDTLKLPEEAITIPLDPFSDRETRLFLEGYFQDVSEEQVLEFKKLTHATPRVMAYALELPGKSLNDKLLPLKPDGKTLEQIFRLRVREAERKATKRQVTAFLKHLIAMPRPVPMDFVTSATGLSEAAIGDIRVDLWREILESNREFTFRDEDFETFLRKSYKLGQPDYEHIALKLLEAAPSDEYSSTHLSNFLSKSGMYAELRDIVIEKKYLSYPLDPVKNKEVFIERTKAAMRMSTTEFDPQDFIKLQIVSAEAAKTNSVLEEILLDKPDLAARYGNLQTNQKIYFQSGNPGWFGKVHYRNAAVYARQKETWDLAKQHLRKAREWVDYRNKLDEEELREYRLTAYDLAFGAEAVLHLFGVDKAIEWLGKWNPKGAVYDVVHVLLNNLFALGNTVQIDRWLKNKGDQLRIDLRLLIVQVYFLNGVKIPLDLKKVLAEVAVLSRISKKEDELMESIVACCEACLAAGISDVEVKPLLGLIDIQIPGHPPSLYSTGRSEMERLDLLLRKGLILHLFEERSFTTKDFYPKCLQEKNASTDHKVRSQVEDQVKRFERIYGHLLPAYKIRGNYFFRKQSSKAQLENLGSLLSNFDSDWELNYYQRHEAPGLQKFIILKLLDIAFHQKGDGLIHSIRDRILKGELKEIDLLLSICEKLGRKERLRETVMAILSHTEQIIDSANLSGKEIIDNYTRAAVTASRCSLEAGKYYFDKMVQASTEIDFEAFDQIRSVHELSKLIPPLQNTDLAIQFFRYSEYCHQRMRSWDGFPWDVVVPTLAKLDIRTGFAVVCQWDHRYVRSTDRHYMELITAALEQEFIPADIATGMLAMNRYYYDGLADYHRLLLERIDEAKDHKLKNEALVQIIADMKLHRPGMKNTAFLRGFLDLVKNGKFTDKTIIKDLEGYIAELEAIIVPAPDEEAENGEKSDKKRKALYSKVLKKHAKVAPGILKSILDEIRGGEARAYVNMGQLFSEIAKTAKPGNYIAYLEDLVDVDGIGICYSDFEDGLKILLDNWKNDRQVGEWKKKAFDKIVQSWFYIFFSEDYISYSSLKRLAAILGIQERDFALGLIRMIPEKLDGFSSKVLYQMLSFVYPLTGTEEKQQVLGWILSRWSAKVPEDYAVTVASATLLSGNPAEVVATFLRYHLGHPKKRVRWITAHILRRIVRLGNTDVIISLLDQQDQQDCHPFQDQQNFFYWISAKLYLWVAIARICQESPEVMLPLKDYLLAEIRDRKLPHAQIKYFAQLAAKAILNYQPTAFDAVEKDEIENILSSPFEVIKLRQTEYPEDRERTDLKFSFDSMDTLPYWYEPLGRIFKVGSYPVAAVADKFISEHWGYVGDVRKDDHIRDSDYNETGNRHGSEPRVENLRSYYEYHGMFCAAYTLLQSRQLVVVEDNWRESWEEWLEGWATCWKDFWLSDFNQPTPLVKKYWVNDQQGNPDWEWDIGQADFDELLGLDQKDTLVVHLGATVYIGKDSETLSLRSGLVDPQTAPALLRSFQTRSANENYISMEDDDDHEGYETRSLKERFPMFKIHGWLRQEKTEVEGIDDNDPLFKDVSKSRIRLGNAFQQWSGCGFSVDFGYSYRGKPIEQNRISELWIWSSVSEKDSYSKFSSNGVSLGMKREELKAFLMDQKKDLIVKVEIKRSVERREYKYYPEYTKIYLFRANGRIEILSGDYSTW